MTEIIRDGFPNGNGMTGHSLGMGGKKAAVANAQIMPAIYAVNGRDKPFISPKTKYGFKMAFCTMEGRKELIRLLNSVLPEGVVPIDTLRQFTIRDIGEADAECLAAFDFYGKDQLHRVIGVELLDTPIANVRRRNNYFACKALKAYREDDAFGEFEKTQVLSFQFLTFAIDRVFTGPCIHQSRQKNADNDPDNQLDEISITTVELNKFKKNEAELNENDEILYLVQHLGAFKEIPERFARKRFIPLIERMRIDNLKFGENFRYLAELHKVKLRDLEMTENELKTVSIVRPITRERTHEITQKKCREKFAKTLMAKTSFNMEDIAELTGLSLDNVAAYDMKIRFNKGI